MTRIGISGAGGQLGRLAAQFVLERDPGADLVLITRDPAALSDLAERGAVVRHGDFDAPETVAPAMEGIDRLLFISTHSVSERLRQHGAAIDGIVAAGVGHVAYVSVHEATSDHPADFVAEDKWTEAALRATGRDWTMLRNGLYTEYQVYGAMEAAATGQIHNNNGDGRTAYISRVDCAAVAAAWLVDGGHVGEVLTLTGPELVSQRDVAAASSELIGRPVEYVPISDEEMYQGMLAAGQPEPWAQGFTGYGRAIREGLLMDVTSVVEDLTGRAPRGLREVLEEHRAEIVGP